MNDLAEYSEAEIKLAQLIYDATMRASGYPTTRQSQNLAKKYGPPNVVKTPGPLYFETARMLLKQHEEKIDKLKRDAIEKMPAMLRKPITSTNKKTEDR